MLFIVALKGLLDRTAPQLTHVQAQRILPDDEFPTMMQAFRDPLPTTFRVTGTRGHADVLNAVVRDTYVPFLSDVKLADGRHIGGALQQIPWYPRQLAWTLAVDKQVVRRYFARQR